MIDTADTKLKSFLAKQFAAVAVDVIAKIVDGRLDWSLDIKTHGNNGKIDLPAKSGAHRIKFRLEDKTDLNLRFDASGPIFASSETGQCPRSLATDQIMVDSCDDDELEIIDWNYGAEMDLRYQLNFMNRIGEPQEPLDPIIRNGGGVPPGFDI